MMSVKTSDAAFTFDLDFPESGRNTLKGTIPGATEIANKEVTFTDEQRAKLDEIIASAQEQNLQHVTVNGLPHGVAFLKRIQLALEQST